MTLENDARNPELCVCAFCDCMSGVKGDVIFGTEKAQTKLKEKLVEWDPVHSCPRYSEGHVGFCIDGVDGEWGLCRICCPTMGMTSVGAGLVICGKGDLPCPPSLKWGTIVSKLQRYAQQVGCANVSERCVE